MSKKKDEKKTVAVKAKLQPDRNYMNVLLDVPPITEEVSEEKAEKMRKPFGYDANRYPSGTWVRVYVEKFCSHRWIHKSWIQEPKKKRPKRVKGDVAPKSAIPGALDAFVKGLKKD
jgi:hypothetical protein